MIRSLLDFLSVPTLIHIKHYDTVCGAYAQSLESCFAQTCDIINNYYGDKTIAAGHGNTIVRIADAYINILKIRLPEIYTLHINSPGVLKRTDGCLSYYNYHRDKYILDYPGIDKFLQWDPSVYNNDFVIRLYSPGKIKQLMRIYTGHYFTFYLGWFEKININNLSKREKKQIQYEVPLYLPETM